MSETGDPQTPEEWQEAADLAEFHLMIHATQRHGLTGGPKINARRCRELLKRAVRMKIHPAPLKTLVERYFGSQKGAGS